MSPKHRILVADDDPISREIMSEVLSEFYDVCFVVSGEATLQKALSYRPDVILLDVVMPGMDGYETCRRLRAIPQLRYVKIILVSAKAMLEERLQGYQVGADEYITKPFDQNELIAKMRVFLRLKTVEEVDELRTNILNLLRHQTRTPLTGILAPAEVLMDDEELDLRTRKELARMVHDNARRLHAYLEDGALLCRFKAAEIQLQRQPLDLSQLVVAVLNTLSDDLEAKELLVDREIADSVLVAGDVEHLHRVILTILGNAIRFSPHSGRIGLKLAVSDEQATLRVTDYGIGIEPAKIPQLFDAFFVADINTVGTGLSLALARAIIDCHGGEISAHSVPGRITTFAIALPRASEDPSREKITVPETCRERDPDRNPVGNKSGRVLSKGLRVGSRLDDGPESRIRPASERLLTSSQHGVEGDPG